MDNSLKNISKEEVKDRIKFFQNIQALPLSEEFDHKGWLGNFKNNEEKFIASLMLDFFIYYPSNMVDSLLKASIQFACSKLSEILPGWHNTNANHNTLFSYIPGEQPNITDSGFTYVRKVKKTLGIDENNIIDFDRIPQELDRRGDYIRSVIFVDDFIGSGSQCDHAWNRLKVGPKKISLSEIAKSTSTKFIFAPLLVNIEGFERIKRSCKELHITPAHIIGKEYDLFNEKCYCWKGEANYFEKGVSLIEKYSKKLNIPFSEGKEVTDYRGYNKQGLALSFYDSCPDATIPLFYWCENNWTPLIKRNYERTSI